MADSVNRRINLYINGKEVQNNIVSVKNEMRKLVNEQARMEIGSKEYIAQTAKIKTLKGIITEHNEQLKTTTNRWSSFKTILVGLGAGFSLRTVISGFKSAAEAANQFEERLDNLQALTGLSGDKLKYLADAAKETSVKVTKEGVRIKQSATEILDAYTKVGSQRPELLKNAEALAAVAEKAIILSEAGKMQLDPAVTAVTASLNQFNLQASDTDMVINAIAAGSQEGAADIPYLTEAIDKAGTTMHLMNIQFENGIGIIEAIAPNFTNAAVAGNSLDKVLLKMKENNIGFVDGVFDINTAIDQVKEKINNGTSAATIFGVEHAKMAEILVSKQADIERYTKAVTGTSKAFEQAAINTDNNAAKLKQAQNQLTLFAIAIGDSVSPAFVGLATIFGRMAENLRKMIEPQKKQIDLYRLEDKELENLFGTLKNVELSQDARSKLINEINSKYGKYLPNLLTEKSTLEEIETAQKAVNDQVRINIISSAMKQEIIDLLKAEKDAVEGLVTSELSAAKAKQQYTMETDAGVAKSLEMQMQAAEITKTFNKSVIDNTANAEATIKEKYKKIAEYYQIAFDSILKASNDLNNTETPPAGKETKKSSPVPSKSDIEAQHKEMSDTLKKLEGELFEQLAADEQNFIVLNEEEKAALYDEYNKKKNEFLLQYQTTTLEQLKQAEFEHLNNLYTEGLLLAGDNEEKQKILKEEFDKAKLKLTEKYNDLENEENKKAQDEKLEKIKDTFSKILAINQTTSDAIRAIEDFAMLGTELRLANGVINEEEAEKERKEIKKKYADVEMVSKIAQIGAATATGAIESFKSLAGIPIVGPILGGIAAASAVTYGGIQIANAVRERNIIKQLAKGKYNVVGADDGKNYNNVPYYGVVTSSGFLNNGRPTLINESGKEMVLSSPHVDNIRMNYPEIMHALMATRVPQRADGSVPTGDISSYSSAYQKNFEMTEKLSNAIDILILAVAPLTKAIQPLAKVLEKPITARISYDHLEEETKLMSGIKNTAKLASGITGNIIDRLLG